MNTQHAQEVAAQTATAVSAASASYAWLGTANDVMTLLATGVAIVSGIYAALYYRAKRKHIHLLVNQDKDE